MKFRLPLAPKIALWLVLNVLLLLAVGVSTVWWRGGIEGWMLNTIGDRFRIVADNLANELNEETREGRERLLRGYEADYGLTFMIVLNDGTRMAGPAMDVPAEVVERMNGKRKPRPERDGPALHPAPPPRPAQNGPPPGDRPPPRPGEPRRERNDRDEGRILLRAGEPQAWWMGARVPVRINENAPPRPGTLFAVSESALSFGVLFDLRPILLAVGVSLVVSVLFWLPLVAGITRDLRALLRATDRIAEGKFDVRVPATRGDEIGRLGESVNVMAGRLHTLVAGQKKFLADVAHELGSPLGRMQLGTGILEERVAEGLRRNVEDVREEVELMSVLVGELLDFTKADLGGTAAPLESVKLADVVACVVDREGAGTTVVTKVPAGIEVCGNRGLLVRAMANVVRNAVRHGGPTVHIEVTAKPVGRGWVSLAVEDDGPGVPPEALARLGEPFFRPDAARQRETGGSGLGLSIVRKAVEAMRGEVRFANRVDGGFVVELRLRSEAPDFTQS